MLKKIQIGIHSNRRRKIETSSKGIWFLAVPGLMYIDDFLTPEEEASLIEEINMKPWDTSIKRRVQHYGYRYDYASKKALENIGKLPDFTLPVIKRIMDRKLMSREPEQLIINEYKPGQGIAPHTDHTAFFEDEIISISLGSSVVMDFINGKETKSVLLKRRSLLLMTGDARYRWKHTIAARKVDKIENLSFTRDCRISLTFRKMKKKE